MTGFATTLAVVPHLDLAQKVNADCVEGEVFRLEKIHEPWVPRDVGVEPLTGPMKDTKGTFLDKGADRFPLVCGNMGKVTTPAVLES